MNSVPHKVLLANLTNCCNKHYNYNSIFTKAKCELFLYGCVFNNPKYFKRENGHIIS